MLSASEITAMTSTVTSSLDQRLLLYHVIFTQGASGNTVDTYPGWPDTPTFTLACNIYAPSAEQLTTYANIIAGRRAMMLRYMPAQDVHEGDRIVYQGLNWRVQPLETAESYTFANDVMIVVIT